MNMRAEHITSEALRDFARGALPPADVLFVSRHLSACASCASMAEGQVDDGAIAKFEAYLSAAPHLSMDDDHAETAAHLLECRICREDMEDRRAATRRPRRALWLSLAAAAVAAGVFVIAVREPASTPQTEIAHTPPPVVVDTAPAETVVLRDRTGDIRKNERGELLGIPPQFARRMASVIASRKFEAETELAALTHEIDALRGRFEKTADGTLIAPVAAVVLETRPVFSWDITASTMKIEIYDEHYQLVDSAPLDSRRTEWRPSRALPRGRTYAWQIVVGEGDDAHPIPRAPQPPARFHVLSAAAADEIDAARRTGSHLVIAETLARHGMRAEADRELRALEALNPDSELLRALRASLYDAPMATKPAQ